MFRVVFYFGEKNSSTITKFADWESANRHLCCKLLKLAGCTGGHIEQYTGNCIGWVLCNENPLN